MKIISWNCNMAFRKKTDKVMSLKPDILIIIECEQKHQLEPVLKDYNYKEIIWHGDNSNKGIAIVNFTTWSLELCENYNPEFKYILPFKINATALINLFVIWAMPHASSSVKGYVGQIWQAINYYSEALNDVSILIGDFNSHVRWDKQRKNNHSSVVTFLKEKNIQSVYHKLMALEQGLENHPTWYMYKQKERAYHLDYCFVSSSLLSEDSTIEIGKYQEWIKLSDHMPIIIDKLKVTIA